MLSKQQISDRVWVIYGDTNEEVAKAFVRFQEYYEGETLRSSKSITVKDVEAWWEEARKKQDTEDSYYQFWQGFNLPGKIILEVLTDAIFRRSVDEFGALRSYPEEETLIQLVSEIPPKELYRGYVIGLSKDTNHVLDHEIAHALFATNDNYKSSQLHNISRLPKPIYEMLRGDLISMGYHPAVVLDEMQAYLSTYVDLLPETFETNDYTAHTGPFVSTFTSFSDFTRKAIVIDKLRFPDK